MLYVMYFCNQAAEAFRGVHPVQHPLHRVHLREQARRLGHGDQALEELLTVRFIDQP